VPGRDHVRGARQVLAGGGLSRLDRLDDLGFGVLSHGVSFG
jgi:hypothetical protein